MFDALEDCPKDFQTKLIQVLNSVADTIQVSPVDAFNVVLCASNKEAGKDAVKKMYNWWKGVFEILSKCDVPDDRKKEYDDLVDALMAEITRTGNDVPVNEAEEYGYERASIEDQEVMLKDMEFAISRIGEIANRVQELINFVNPYCQSFNEDKNMKFKKIDERIGGGSDDEWISADDLIGMRVGESNKAILDDPDCEWVSLDDLNGVSKSDMGDDLSLKTEGFYDFNDDGEDPIISYEDDDGNHSVMVVSGHDEMGDVVYQVKRDEEEWTTTSNLEEAKMEARKLVDRINRRKDVDYQLMQVNETRSDNIDVPQTGTGDNNIRQTNEDGSRIETPSAAIKRLNDQFWNTAYGKKNSTVGEAKVDKDVNDVSGEPESGEDGEHKTLVTGEGEKDDNNKKNKTRMCEMTIEQEIDDPWRLSELLWGQGKENLQELLRSDLVGEEEVMQMLEDMGIRDLTGINDVFAYEFPMILESLGLDGSAWNQNLEIKLKGDYDDDDDEE